MPGFPAHEGAVTLCAHGGRATPAVLNPRVTVSGRATVVLGSPWPVTACPLPVAAAWAVRGRAVDHGHGPGPLARPAAGDPGRHGRVRPHRGTAVRRRRADPRAGV